MKARFHATALSFGRHSENLFSQLEFSLDSGRGIIIYGENGSGKTSLLRVLAGLLPPTEGSIYWEGRDIQQALYDYHQHLHFLGHACGLKNKLSVKENLLYSHGLASSEPARPEAIEAALEAAGLLPWQEKLAGQLSAGQKRRLALARLLVSPKPLWLLDEPLTNLDQAGQRWFSELLEQQLRQGGSLILASHQPLVLSQPQLFTQLSLSTREEGADV